MVVININPTGIIYYNYSASGRFLQGYIWGIGGSAGWQVNKQAGNKGVGGWLGVTYCSLYKYMNPWI